MTSLQIVQTFHCSMPIQMFVISVNPKTLNLKPSTDLHLSGSLFLKGVYEGTTDVTLQKVI